MLKFLLFSGDGGICSFGCLKKNVNFLILSFSDIFAILVESCCPYIMIQHCFWVQSALASHSWFGEDDLLKLSGSFLRQSSALLL